MSAQGGTVVARHVSGDRLQIEVRGHVVLSDQPLEDGGEDTAATPTEIFVGSLAGCVAFYAERFLRRHGLAPGVAVTASYEWATEPHRVGAIEVRVEAPSVPPNLLPAFERVVERCPIHNTLASPPRVSFAIAQPAA